MVENQGQRVDILLGAISRWALIVGAILGAAIILGNAYEVIARYAFNNPTGVMDELLVYADTGLIWLALAWGWRTKSHIYVDIVTERLHGRVRSELAFATLVVSFLTAVGLAFAVWTYELELIRTWRRPDTNLGTPWAIPHILVSFGITIFCLEVLLTLYNEIRLRISRKQAVPTAQTVKEESNG